MEIMVIEATYDRHDFTYTKLAACWRCMTSKTSRWRFNPSTPKLIDLTVQSQYAVGPCHTAVPIHAQKDIRSCVINSLSPGRFPAACFNGCLVASCEAVLYPFYVIIHIIGPRIPPFLFP